MSDRLLKARRALRFFGLDGAEVEPLDGGLINWTFLVRTKNRRFVLQRVSSIFEPAVCDDLRRVTEHLARRGVATPTVVPTTEGHAYAASDGDVWRAMTHVPGRTYARVESPRMAAAAGRALGRFHSALVDYAQPFAARRLGVHDLDAHLEGLRTAVQTRRDHRRWDVVAPLAEAILTHRIPALPQTTDRIVHGDPKISNLVFDPASGAGRAWVDLDTVAPMPLPLEMGDALRSWCNRAGEERPEAELDLDTFEAALRGYLGTARFVTEDEARCLVEATERIALELAARFARDALEERYFGWSEGEYPSASHHHAHRAEVQLSLARSVAHLRSGARKRLERALQARVPAEGTT